MSEKQKKTVKGGSDRVQCHFISNTHWDREWRYSMQRIRYMLVYMIDMLLDIFEKEPGFKSFHMDSQAVPLQDYLEIRPEREKDIRKYVESKKLFVGPWFCLPDEYCVGGESLIRNLLLGHKVARRFGHVSKTGYSPFSWGQISQMPQIYQGFGIGFIAFYRGVNTLIAPNSEFIWEGPDGSRIVGSRLAKRPRYNVWALIQRPVYWNVQDVECRDVFWSQGNSPFHFIDAEHVHLDYQYAHPKFEYHEEYIDKCAKQTMAEQDNEWTTVHRFWSSSMDSSCPDIREARMIADCKDVLKDVADVYHSTFADFQEGVCRSISDDLPLAYGEMRHAATQGSSSELIGWVISARMNIKQDNFRTERELISYAEPLAAFAHFLGGNYPQRFLDTAYNYLLQNHGHDSIGGCSRDIVHDDMLYRTRQCREIASCITERALIDIAGSINMTDWDLKEIGIIVYNPAAFERTEIVPVTLDIPSEFHISKFDIVDCDGTIIDMHCRGKELSQSAIVQCPNDTTNRMAVDKWHLVAEFGHIPPMGYKTFRLKPLLDNKLTQPQSMLAEPQTMENEFIRVTINFNGTLKIKDKHSGKTYDDLGYFRDSGEIGNPWQHESPVNDSVFTTLNQAANIVLVRDGGIETSFRISINWVLPQRRSADERSRSENLRPYQIINTITLRKDQPWVEIITEVDNNIEDHYLQVSFPTSIQTGMVSAQGQFDVIERSIAKPDFSIYKEAPHSEQPMNSFVDISDGKIGLTLLNEGLKAYEAHADANNTLSLTLLRSFPLRICVLKDAMSDYSSYEKGSQCLGRQRFRYAVMPHAGNWQQAQLWQIAERFNLAFHICQVGVSKHGTEALSKSFLEIKPTNIHVSAVKRSENGLGWIVRIFNPFDQTVSASLRLNGGFSGSTANKSPVERVQSEFMLLPGNQRWSRVQAVTLEEIPEKVLEMDSDGWVTFEITKKRILTFEFLA